MKTFSFSRAGGAALALALGLACSGAWAAQSITVSTAVAHDVCGNGNAANDGASPCANSPDGNTVTIDSAGQVTGFVRGGSSAIAAGDVTASGNTVTVTGAVTGNVFGGFAQTGSGNATSSDNTVLIDGGAISNGSIIGGDAYSATTAATATGNTVTIQGSPTFTGVGNLSGGEADVRSNNTLNLHVAGLTVMALYDFQNLNFFLPAGLTTASPMLTASNHATLGTNTVVHVSLEGATLHTGDSFVLLNNVDVGNTIAAASASGTVGGYKYTLEIDASRNLLLTIGASAAANAAAVPTLGESSVALLALLLAGLGLAAMRRKG